MNRVDDSYLDLYRFFPGSRIVLVATLVMLGGGTACTPGSWFSPQDSGHDEQPDPYVQFIQAVTAVEPLVSPELEALAQSQSGLEESQVPQGVSLPPVVPLDIDGDLAIATSPKLLPLNEVIYERFVQAGYRGIMTINAINPTSAIRQFCQQPIPGVLTISRLMTSGEIAACKAQKRSPVALPFGQDALVLVVNPDNTFTQGVTLANLADLLTQRQWSNVNVDWPQRPIDRHLMGPNSSSVSVLAQILFEGDESILQTAETTFFQYVEPMMQSLSIAPEGIGILSYSTVQRSPFLFRVLPINGVTASPATIRQGNYPLAQTLYLYVDQQQLTAGSSVTDWVNFYFTQLSEVMPEVTLLSLNEQQFQNSITQWSTLDQKGTLPQKINTEESE